MDDYSTKSYQEVIIIDSLFKDSMTLSYFDNMGVNYLNFDLTNITVATPQNDNDFYISGQFDVTNLLSNPMTSSFSFHYIPPGNTSSSWHGFLYWNDNIGTTYYSNSNLNAMLYSMDNLQLHTSGDYQLDSVTVTTTINTNCDSLFGNPSYARFYPK